MNRKDYVDLADGSSSLASLLVAWLRTEISRLLWLNSEMSCVASGHSLPITCFSASHVRRHYTAIVACCLICRATI